jgi:aspartate/methionine/tyrosine aminotransferase
VLHVLTRSPSKADVSGRNAGFFLWVDLSACLHSPTWEAEDDLKERLYDFGVEMAAARGYHGEAPGHFRFLFSVDKASIEEGARRVVEFYGRNRMDRVG